VARVVATSTSERMQVILHDGEPTGSKIILQLRADGHVDVSCSAAPSALMVRNGLLSPLPVIGGTGFGEDDLQPGGVIAAFSASFLEALPLESVAHVPLLLTECVDPQTPVEAWRRELTGVAGPGTAVLVARWAPAA